MAKELRVLNIIMNVCVWRSVSCSSSKANQLGIWRHQWIIILTDILTLIRTSANSSFFYPFSILYNPLNNNMMYYCYLSRFYRFLSSIFSTYRNYTQSSDHFVSNWFWHLPTVMLEVNLKWIAYFFMNVRKWARETEWPRRWPKMNLLW